MKKGFTLIELLAVITILAAIIILIIGNIENTIEDASRFANASQIETIESATEIYIQTNNIDLGSTNVKVIELSTLVEEGLIRESKLNGLSQNNKILVAKINGFYKYKYIGETEKPVIFITGSEEVTVVLNNTYIDDGAYVAIPNIGIEAVVGTSSVNTSVAGEYNVTYNYTNADTVTRKVNVKNITN